MDTKEKLAALKELLRSYGSVAIGFSGGVDSTFLAAVCQEVLPQSTLLIHLSTPLIGTPEQSSFEQATFVANERPLLKLPVLNLKISQLESADVVRNDPLRCYYCKKLGFTQIANEAAARGYNVVVDGSNASDVGDYRPGMKAVEELSVKSPLQDVGFTKAEERELLRQWGFPVWNMPAGACLATRIPTNEPLTREKVSLVRASEDYLHQLGYSQIRARLVQGVMHIEMSPEDLQRLGGNELTPEMQQKLRALGCTKLESTVKPYGKGNMNA